MRKRESYKIFNKLNTIIAVVIVAIMGLGITYAYWSDTLTVSAKVNTGKVRVEGVLAYAQTCEYPTHTQNDCPQGSECTFKTWWQDQDPNIFIGNSQTTRTPIKIEHLKLAPGIQNDKIAFTGTGDIVFTIQNTGDVIAKVRLNPSSDNYKKTWIKLSAPTRGSVNTPGSRSTLAQGFINVNLQQMIVNKVDETQEVIAGGESFYLNPGQEATVILAGCQLKVYGGENPDYDPSILDFSQMCIEAQVSLSYEDPTGSWYDNTCNSLFMNRRVTDIERPQLLGCEQCDIKCKGRYEPVKSGEICGAFNLCSKPSHCNGFCPCFKHGKPNGSDKIDMIPEGEENRPVTLPTDEVPEAAPEVEPQPNAPDKTPEAEPLPSVPDKDPEVELLPSIPDKGSEVESLPSVPDKDPEVEPLPSIPDDTPSTLEEVVVTIPEE